jgi:putative hydrolase of HD superfamily
MALIHDIVEIDCGDAFFYDEQLRLRRKAQEKKAAQRIFNLLPRDQAAPLIRLWREFEERKTPEARFAAALDRFQPILHNYKTAGRVWKRGKVSPGEVLAKNAHINDGVPALWEYVQKLVKDGVRKGYFKKR